MKDHYETIIIGGGISGLSCGRKLHDAGHDFLLVSKELGGRMKWDETTGINMGAGIVMSHNKNILKYIAIKRRKTHQSVKGILICDDRCSHISTIILENLPQLPKILKFLFILWRFDRHVKRAIKRMPYQSVDEVLERDPFLKTMFLMPATEFVREHKLEEISRKYVNPIIASTFYTTYDNVSAFYYLGNLAPVFSKIYIPDFTHTVEKITQGFEKKILVDTVVKVTKQDGIFEVQTLENEFTADHIVFAAPEQSLQGVYDLPRPYMQQAVHRFVIKGERKKEYRSHKVLFNPDHHYVLSISGEKEYDIVSASKEDPDFSKYYESYEIIHHIHWTPATIIPRYIIDQNPEENLYIASDYNFCALEFSFISGLYAANQIIKSTESK